MPNLNTAQFTLTGMTTKRSLGERLSDKWFSILDFGADPTGATDSTEAIQLALDTAYGTAVAPHGSPDLSNAIYTFHTGDLLYTNRTVYFPAGDYKITSMLKIHVGYGVTLIGAGSHQTRLFWSGAAEPVPEGEDETGRPATLTALLSCYHSWRMYVEGITFDASDTQQAAFRAHHWPADATASAGSTGDDGSGGLYIDVHFTNATSSGFISSGRKMGSERTFWFCRFTNNTLFGHRLHGQNALNHSFYNCHFENNSIGISAIQAGHSAIDSCTFVNQGRMDINQQYGGRVVNCSSTSLNFFCGDGVLIANRHVNASPGVFCCYVNLGTPNLNGSTGKSVFIGNYSSNGIFGGDHQGADFYFRGNTFDDPDFYDARVAAGLHIHVVDSDNINGTDHNPN